MLIQRIQNKQRSGKTDCNSAIPDSLRPFHLPSEIIEALVSRAKRNGIPTEALVSSIIQEAIWCSVNP